MSPLEPEDNASKRAPEDDIAARSTEYLTRMTDILLDLSKEHIDIRRAVMGSLFAELDQHARNMNQSLGDGLPGADSDPFALGELNTDQQSVVRFAAKMFNRYLLSEAAQAMRDAKLEPERRSDLALYEAATLAGNSPGVLNAINTVENFCLALHSLISANCSAGPQFGSIFFDDFRLETGAVIVPASYFVGRINESLNIREQLALSVWRAFVETLQHEPKGVAGVLVSKITDRQLELVISFE